MPNNLHQSSINLAAGPDETLDILDEHGLKLIQPRRGYRFSVDALLLAGFAHGRGRLLDIGCGCGILSVLLARKSGIDQVTGLELQPELADIATRNVCLNGLEDKINILQGDARRLETMFKRGEFDAVVANPPYWRSASGRVNPGADKACARHEINLTLEHLSQACAYAVRGGGRINIIYPASRLTEVIETFKRHRLEPKRLQFVHPNPSAEASLFMLYAATQARPGIHLLPPLFVPGKETV